MSDFAAAKAPVQDQALLGSNPADEFTSSESSVSSASIPAAQEMEDIIHYKELLHVSPPEHTMKQVFDKYSSGNDNWTPADVRRFLLDFLPAVDLPAFAPEEVVQAAISEIQLNHSSTAISWVEFKSFFLYLHQVPFGTLLQAVSAHIPVNELSTHAVILSDLPTHVEYTAENVAQFLLPTQVSKLFLYAPTGQAIAILPNSDSLHSVLPLNGHQFATAQISVAKYEGQRFPFLAPPVPKASPVVDAFTSVLAKGLVLAQEFDEKNKITDRVKTFDEEHKIIETLSTTAQKGVAAVKEMDQKYKVTETISHKAQELNQNYHISEKVNEAKAAVMSNATFQKGLSFFDSLASKAKATVQEIRADTLKKTNDIKTHSSSSSSSAQPGAADAR